MGSSQCAGLKGLPNWERCHRAPAVNHNNVRRGLQPGRGLIISENALPSFAYKVFARQGAGNSQPAVTSAGTVTDTESE